MPSLVRYAKQGSVRMPRLPVAVESAPRREKLTPEQRTWRRYEDWRIAHEVGFPDEDGTLKRRSVSMIADIYGVTPTSVFRGIKAARDLRAMLQDGAVA